MFAFLNIQTTEFGRALHLVSTSWCFVLMAIHLGMHLNVIMFKLNKKMKNSTFEYVYYLILILIILSGVYFFINSEIWKDMFLINEFKFFDYNQSPIIFYIGEVTIVCFISFMTYLLLRRRSS